ncbi:MAG TPA: hypothetical protein VK184_22625 [Nostocaceae cyanobacterium]|nr:hypothetical protein [Nostocaceae cyanobacterium]
MKFANYIKLPLCRKQKTVEIEKLTGVWLVNWKIGRISLYSTYYTCVDRACMLWILFILPMFITPHFFAVSWTLQAILWSILSLAGIGTMIILAYNWVKDKQVTWLLYSWTSLILIGLIITDLSIFLGWGEILVNLCSLWLILSAIGYLCTSVALRSLAFFLTAIIHCLVILILPYLIAWQFLLTGIFMAACLFILAEFRWDTL